MQFLAVPPGKNATKNKRCNTELILKLGLHKKLHTNIHIYFHNHPVTKAWISQEVLDLSEERNKIKQAKQDDPSLKPRYIFLYREIKSEDKGQVTFLFSTYGRNVLCCKLALQDPPYLLSWFDKCWLVSSKMASEFYFVLAFYLQICGKTGLTTSLLKPLFFTASIWLASLSRRAGVTLSFLLETYKKRAWLNSNVPPLPPTI